MIFHYARVSTNDHNNKKEVYKHLFKILFN